MKSAIIPQTDFLPKAGAGCLMFIGVSIFVMSLAAPFATAAGWVLYGVIAAAFFLSGLFWYRFAVGSERSLRQHHEEKEILAAASRHNGQVTSAQLALETSLTAQQVNAALERMSRDGVVRPDLLDDGTVVYRFAGLLGEGE